MSAFLLFSAASHAAESPLITSSRRALSESAPQIAIAKIETWLATAPAAGAERNSVMQLLAEAQFSAGLYDEALLTVAPLCTRGGSEAWLLKANALAGAGRWSEALPAYRDAGRESGNSLMARLGEAESLQALSRTAEAVEVLEAVVREAPTVTAQLRLASLYVEIQKLKKAHALLGTLKPVDPRDVQWKQYVDARLLLAEGHPALALAVFDQIIGQPHTRGANADSSLVGVDEGLVAGATIGACEARAQLRGYDAADKPLETFVWNYPDSPWLELVFRRLDQIYAQQQNPGESELWKWADKVPPRRAALALFYLGRMQFRAHKDKTAKSLSSFLETYPTHALVPYVHLMQADLLIEKRDLDGAVMALDAAERAVRNGPLRGEIELRRGLVLFQQRQYLLAANEFQRAAQHSPKLRDSATYNAALAALNQQNYERFLTEYRALTDNSPESPLRSSLILEEGLVQARNADARAEDTLQLFLNHFPFSPRQAEARLALAELKYQDGNQEGAANYLKVAAASPTEPAAAEHAEYLEVFLAETDPVGGGEKVIEQATDFIRKHPKSALLPEVRMKLGQVHFHHGNFAAAETQFATLAAESPTSDYAETALFLAGQSAMRSINPGSVDRALKLFDEVVKRGGSLKLYARQQQAIAQAQLGKESEAVILYDAILSAQPGPEDELRYATLAGKGEALLVLGRREKAQLNAALAVFDQLAKLPGVPPSWRNQALYKKAGSLELLDRHPEAITALYDVLDEDSAAPREYFWFYKAGFDLAARFEEQANWKSAIGIYEKLARVEGPRAADATARAKDLRLKHFIWE